ncbi:hypothetical protein BUALT_Bualt15G0120500 [Buddleja alternifolia]|uniref:Uncharacterized protein n=1 Tax=Buddleja alternifolia TaxID=168488 RepID=A0AAV6WF42_9LAMI|nr:hypothetical protein BUALT_Bualt15G0120500 [Buddleja alternifolia]
MMTTVVVVATKEPAMVVVHFLDVATTLVVAMLTIGMEGGPVVLVLAAVHRVQLARQFGFSNTLTTAFRLLLLPMEFSSSDAIVWREALSSYDAVLKNLGKENLILLDNLYRKQLPNLLHERDPNPYITADELSKLMEWKLSRGKWRPRLLSFVSSLTDAAVRDASAKAFASLPHVSTAVKELTVLKGVGPATASAVLAAYAPDVAPFMSDEAMEAVVGDSKDYSLKRYLIFMEKIQAKAKELSTGEDLFTASDVERALWSSAIGAKSVTSSTKPDEVELGRKSKRKRK